MTSSPSPDAYYDGLVVVDALTTTAGGATRTDVALFAYLACLLAAYTGQPPAKWGYAFVSTPSAAPYSPDLDRALHELVGSSLVRDVSGVMVSDVSGRDEIVALTGLSRFVTRRRYLDAACGSTVSLPLPRVTGGVASEPSLRTALALSSTRPLLGEGGSAELLAHFSALHDAVGPSGGDLVVPAVVWLTYLSERLDAESPPPNDNRDSDVG